MGIGPLSIKKDQSDQLRVAHIDNQTIRFWTMSRHSLVDSATDKQISFKVS